jgi:2-(1,2-epoxy-1,2-dihydrophenyl)acetyl-CoA isomerase
MTHIILEVRATIGVVTLNRPANANAIDLEAARQLQAVVSDLVTREDIRAIVLLGRGRHFCAGGDVRTMARESPTWTEQVAAAVHEAILALHETDQVVVAGVHGAVAGAGLSLTLVSDLVVATPSTRFLAAWPEIGLTPDAGATWLLPRTVGSHRAAAMILGDREINGSEALDWGLVTELAEESQIEARSLEVAKHALRSQTRAAGVTRRLLSTSWDIDLRARLDQERDAVATARQENQAALARFLARATS